jgi:hypothetical protein
MRRRETERGEAAAMEVDLKDASFGSDVLLFCSTLQPLRQRHQGRPGLPSVGVGPFPAAPAPHRRLVGARARWGRGGSSSVRP